MRVFLLALLLISCGSKTRGEGPQESPTPANDESNAVDAPPVAPAQLPPLSPIAAEPQREGKVQAGYQALVGKNYIGCGVPRPLVDRFFGQASGAWLLDNRPPLSEGLPYFLNGYETSDGTPMATANCLSCHASMLRGSLMIGLGETRIDFTEDATGPLALASLIPTLGEAGADFKRLIERVRTIAPYIRTRVIGPNPGDAIAAVLFAHRDAETLAWSKELLIQEPPKVVTPIDVPAWWLLKKKNAMFFTGAGRGDHARIMMSASALCTDTVAQAKKIDSYFPDIRSYLLSLEAPDYPFEVDEARASTGEGIFNKRCKRCHGSYGDSPEYPNLLVSVEEVGTDSILAIGSGQFAAPYVKWFSESFYGEIARLEPGRGYVAPPLDGIWATGPFFHNGSVPTVRAVLDSSTRPQRWVDGRSRYNYLEADLGFVFSIPSDQNAPAAHTIYDTKALGHSNSGHTYGDTLNDDERGALIEYLKTL